MSDFNPLMNFKLQRVQKAPDSDRFSSSPAWTQDAQYEIVDPETQKTWGFVCIDNTQRGPGLGGIRMAPNITLNEVSRLSRVMTHKNSAACIPYGGGKAGLVLNDPAFLSDPQTRAMLMEKFADALFELENYVPAPDMGTNEKDVQIIHNNHSQKLGTQKHSRGGAGRPINKGGIPIDDWELTAHGLFSAIKVIESVDESLDLSKTNFIVQGFGNVGAPTAIKLQEAGATLVGASDINIALWNSKGLDVHLLNKVRKEIGGLRNYPLEVEKKFSQDKLDWLLEAPCDVMVPCARPDAITAKNVDRVQCRYILQGANTPSSKPIEYYLHHRHNILSLTDFIVNAGGVIGCAVERNMIIDDSYADKVKQIGVRTYVENLICNTISNNVLENYTRMKNCKGYIFRDAATELATERLFSQEMWL
ncbi:MAG: Glu/Leu/Phe/Val dehydrogenase [Nitrospina sp.]|jgi:glutamate dehydrogenase (NAD(P)+)|nr:Glu/Leu/Phe/Val dehydrogenase [Nitrospina sp.]MBT3875924.1 Glu/Leu/Phe/Val dehydrogenase [Nitrospina sp.]MBT4046941.1 Glu/Leu/Phe/Val dehydrogenase [Nitrospina sp.]MBT4557339.1 Glu/Leu/Phe/Val dehydrogenase [Nitrospina sp.]MBT5347611.1 Glu/Leu/Phe/Val dehydrogenase [Nitrospina sp.]